MFFNDFKGGIMNKFQAQRTIRNTLIDHVGSNKKVFHVAVKVLDPEKLKSFLEILSGFVKKNGTLQ
jgi:hypothetical protein